MNNKPALEALIRRNALACEKALKPRCKCQYKRALHRKPHSEEWIQETIARLAAEGEANA
jgi:hypothetical protein